MQIKGRSSAASDKRLNTARPTRNRSGAAPAHSPNAVPRASRCGLGISPPNPLIVPDQVKARLWHIPFNQQDKINELLVTGRENIFFGAEFDASAGTAKLPEATVKYYIDGLSNPDALHGSFQLYRAFGATAAQNERRKTRRLAMPVLAMGGAESLGAMTADTMRLTADDVQTLVIPGVGHWLAEQAPEQLVAALTEFFAPTPELVR
jgi:pimeloyl-ACP methyl ester carboxylesterase